MINEVRTGSGSDRVVRTPPACCGHSRPFPEWHARGVRTDPVATTPGSDSSHQRFPVCNFRDGHYTQIEDDYLRTTCELNRHRKKRD
jgi:hypothetical protein